MCKNERLGFYQPPSILRREEVECETAILAASIHESVTVETTGHEVKNIDWSETPFNHSWE